MPDPAIDFRDVHCRELFAPIAGGEQNPVDLDGGVVLLNPLAVLAVRAESLTVLDPAERVIPVELFASHVFLWRVLAPVSRLAPDLLVVPVEDSIAPLT